MVTPEVRYARNGDVALAYQVVGEGPVDLMLVSGYLSNIQYAWSYPSLATFLSRLATFSRLILVDKRGSGLSDRFDEPPPLETTLRDLEVVLDEAASTRTALLGIWDGCETSVLFAATHPERVSSLALFTISAAQRKKPDYPWAWTDDAWRTWLASIRTGWGTRSWIVKNARWMGPSMLDHPRELEHWIAYTRLAASPSSAEAVMRLSSDSDIRSILPVVEAPTLILHRVGDQIEPIEGARYVASKMPNARLVELPGDDGIPWLGDTEPVLSEIEQFLAQRRPSSTSSRRLATVLFTDIVDSTGEAAKLGDARWSGRLREHHSIATREIQEFNGQFVDSAGDGILATFEGPAAAVRCATAITQGVAALGLRIRAGVHTGEIEQHGASISGLTVHIGARVMALAGPSEVLVSSTVRDLAAGSSLMFEDIGERDLKGVPGRWRLFRLTGDGIDHQRAD